MKRKAKSATPEHDAVQGTGPAPHPLWFVGRFLAGLAVGQFAVVYFTPIEGWAVRTTLASLRSFSLIGLPARVDGTSFSVGPHAVTIIGDCTPLQPSLVLAAAILAYPSLLRFQLMGIVAGAAVLWGFNLLRIGALIAILTWAPKTFDFVHMYLWQTATLLLVLLLFLLWLRLQRPRSNA